MSESQKKLFKGQNTHPLSQAEKQALAKKIKFKDVSAEDQKKIYAAFKEIMNYPTGREQIRKIIAFKQKDCVIGVAAGMGINGGASADSIILAKEILENPQSCGMTLFHELLHVRQDSSNNFNKMNAHQMSGIVLLDEAEPHALTSQLACEMNHNPDVMYKEYYEKSLDKWRQVANGKQPRPKNIPALTYEPNLTAAEKAEARESYAKLLAALECRGKATKDFVKPMNEIDDDLISYYILYRRSVYMTKSMEGMYRRTEYFPECYKNKEGDPEGYDFYLKDMVSRNPLFVSVDDLKKATISGNNDKEKIGYMAIVQEVEDRFSKGEGKDPKELWDKIVEEKKAKGENLEVFFVGDNPSKKTDAAGNEIKSDHQQRTDLLWFIDSSKNEHPKPKEDRTDAIKKLRELTGNPNLPIVKTTEEAGLDSQVQDALRKAGNPVSTDENPIPVVKDKSLMA